MSAWRKLQGFKKKAEVKESVLEGAGVTLYGFIFRTACVFLYYLLLINYETASQREGSNISMLSGDRVHTRA